MMKTRKENGVRLHTRTERSRKNTHAAWLRVLKPRLAHPRRVEVRSGRGNRVPGLKAGGEDECAGERGMFARCLYPARGYASIIFLFFSLQVQTFPIGCSTPLCPLASTLQMAFFPSAPRFPPSSTNPIPSHPACPSLSATTEIRHRLADLLKARLPKRDPHDFASHRRPGSW